MMAKSSNGARPPKALARSRVVRGPASSERKFRRTPLWEVAAGDPDWKFADKRHRGDGHQ